MIESQRASRQAGSENMFLSWVFKGKTPKHREGLVPSRWGGGGALTQTSDFTRSGDFPSFRRTGGTPEAEGAFLKQPFLAFSHNLSGFLTELLKPIVTPTLRN